MFLAGKGDSRARAGKIQDKPVIFCAVKEGIAQKLQGHVNGMEVGLKAFPLVKIWDDLGIRINNNRNVIMK